VQSRSSHYPPARSPRRGPHRLALIGLLAFALGAVAACGSDDDGSASAAESSDTTVGATVPDSISAGTTLRVGDQLDALDNVLTTSGEDQNFPYELKYGNFVGGPPMLQAFKAGEIDLGFVADTPLIFAQAAKQDIVAVAGWAPERSGFELIVPKGKDISSWKDLKGKKVAYQQGTVLEAVVLKGLDEAGLSLDDIIVVNVPVTEIAPTLLSGDVDAGILSPPLDAAYLAQEPDATIIDAPTDITLRINFLIASKSALSDPAKAAAIGDYAQRLVRGYGWINAHPDEWIQKFYVGQYKMTPEAGAKVLEHAGDVTFVPLPGDIIPDQQRLADLYLDAGEIPQKVDVKEEFDGRYNDAIAEAQQP
jgi:sulfonate transport system substrate-binding protein